MPGVGLIQPLHLLLILVIVMVIFGAGKLSQVGGALGQSVKEFKASVSEDTAVSATAGEGEKHEARATAALPTAPEPRASEAPRPVAPLRREEI